MLFPRGLRQNILNREGGGGADIKWNGPFVTIDLIFIDFQLGYGRFASGQFA